MPASVLCMDSLTPEVLSGTASQRARVVLYKVLFCTVPRQSLQVLYRDSLMPAGVVLYRDSLTPAGCCAVQVHRHSL